jgi:hypothetical protein
VSEPALKLGKWQGRETYGCPYCAFDSLSEQTALDHVYERHCHMEQPKPVHAALFDAAGNLIAR